MTQNEVDITAVIELPFGIVHRHHHTQIHMAIKYLASFCSCHLEPVLFASVIAPSQHSPNVGLWVIRVHLRLVADFKLLTHIYYFKNVAPSAGRSSVSTQSHTVQYARWHCLCLCETLDHAHNFVARTSVCVQCISPSRSSARNLWRCRQEQHNATFSLALTVRWSHTHTELRALSARVYTLLYDK